MLFSIIQRFSALLYCLHRRWSSGWVNQESPEIYVDQSARPISLKLIYISNFIVRNYCNPRPNEGFMHKYSETRTTEHKCIYWELGVARIDVNLDSRPYRWRGRGVAPSSHPLSLCTVLMIHVSPVVLKRRTYSSDSWLPVHPRIGNRSKTK